MFKPEGSLSLAGSNRVVGGSQLGQRSSVGSKGTGKIYEGVINFAKNGNNNQLFPLAERDVH